MRDLDAAQCETATTLRQHLARTFDLLDESVTISGRHFSILKVRDTNALVNAIRPEDFGEDERLPYWADIWTSAYGLARFCVNDATFAGARVLELGCGVGLAGIAAASAGAFVTLSDYEPDALRFAQHNALVNLAPEEMRRVSFLQLDWRLPPALDPFDAIIAADVIYERRSFAPLISMLNSALAPNGVAVFTEPGRAIGESFFRTLCEHAFTVHLSRHAVEVRQRQHEVVRAIIRKGGA